MFLCHDPQPLILTGSSFRTLPRQPPEPGPAKMGWVLPRASCHVDVACQLLIYIQVRECPGQQGGAATGVQPNPPTQVLAEEEP